METVAAALPGPLAVDLTATARLQRLGADPVAAWADYERDPVLAPVVRLVRRSAGSGSRLAAAFERLADERRADAISGGERRAARAAVLATIPLGVCYLPAFVCLGVIPLAVSLLEATAAS
jgi:pilus assembly protein TadC